MMLQRALVRAARVPHAAAQPRPLGPCARLRPGSPLVRTSVRALHGTEPRHSNGDKGTASFTDAHFGGADAAQSDSGVSAGKSASAANGHATHAVISAFDLFSIGIGPSSSHTLGPCRAASIFVQDIKEAGLLDKVARIKVALYGSLAATGEGHHTPQALLIGLEGVDPETVDTASIPTRVANIKAEGKIGLNREIDPAHIGAVVTFKYDTDLTWHWDRQLPLHPNGLRFSVYDTEGDLIATNDYYSIGGGFVVNGSLATANSPNGLQQIEPTSVHDDEGGGEQSSLPDPDGRLSGSDAAPASEATGEIQDILSVAPAGSSPTSVPRTPDAPHPEDLAENAFYKQIRRSDAAEGRRQGQPSEDLDKGDGAGDEKGAGTNIAPNVPFPFHNAASLLKIAKEHNLTIAQIVYQNERTWYSHEEIQQKLFRIWTVMDQCIREGCYSKEKILPGGLGLKRRAPGLYRRLLRGVYPASTLTPPGSAGAGSVGAQAMGPGDGASVSSVGGDVDDELADPFALPTRPASSDGGPLPHAAARTMRMVHGNFEHPIMPVPPKRVTFQEFDFLSTYAIAVNEVNAAGGRVVTSPTNGASGVIPSVLKFHLSFSTDDPWRDVQTFLLTAAAVGMIVRRGATISAAEGGCQAEIGVASAMAAAGYAAVLGGSPRSVAQAAEIGLEHSLGLTCDPVMGLVQAPCIERVSMGAVKAVNAAQLALASDGDHAVSLDDVIEAMRQTARDMHVRYRETSLGGLARVVRVPVTVPEC